MDELDQELVAAFGRVWAWCRDDPAEARRRWERVHSGVYRRPMRPWCLALRASDTRLTEENGAYMREEDVADRLAHEVILRGEAVRKLCAPVRIEWPGVPLTQAAAKLGRSREALRSWLPLRPGRTREARGRANLRLWEYYPVVQFKERVPLTRLPGPGVLENAKVSPVGKGEPVLGVRYEAATVHDHFGSWVPVVWTFRPVDPGAARGETPHAVWGTSWQWIAQRVPERWEQRLVRAPRWRPYWSKPAGEAWLKRKRREWEKAREAEAQQMEERLREARRRGEWRRGPGSSVCSDAGAAPRWDQTPGLVGEDGRVLTSRFRGWDWVCRGLAGPDGKVRTCARRVQTLYLPLPVFTVGKWCVGRGGEVEEGLEVPGLDAGERWWPGLVDRKRGETRRVAGGSWRFACEKCWEMRRMSMADYRGWNEFVTYISGGLLYGREVARPEWVKWERRRAKRRG